MIISKFFTHKFSKNDTLTIYKVNVNGRDVNLIQLYKYSKQKWFNLYRCDHDGQSEDLKFYPKTLAEACNIIETNYI